MREGEGIESRQLGEAILRLTDDYINANVLTDWMKRE